MNADERMRAFIVEDEELFLNDLLAKMEDSAQRYKVAGCAYDGQSALEQIRILKPDIVISDIRLPGMDGLELVARVREDLPDTVFVLVSGFKDFDYAQKAVRLGVKEYIVKPVQADKLSEKLAQIYDMHRREVIERQKSFLLSQITRSDPPLREGLFPTDRLYMFLLCIGNQLHYGTKLYPERLHSRFFETFSWANTLRPIVEEPFWCVPTGCINEQFLFLDVHGHDSARHYAQKLLAGFSGLDLALHLTVAYDAQPVLAGDVGKRSTLLSECLSKQLIAWKPSCIPVSDMGSEKNERGPAKPFLEHFSGSIKEDLDVLLKKAVMGAMQDAYTTNPTQLYMETYTISAISALHAKFPSKVKEMLLQSRYQLVGLISTAASYNQFVQEFSQALLDIYHSKRPEVVEQRMDIAEAVKRLLDEDYRCAIKINDIAANYYISSKHLTRLFKQRYHMPPLQYLIEKRMTQAQRLLLTTQAGVAHIAEAVGYDDVNYFNRLFKSNYGETPSEYRAKRQELQK